MKKQLISLLFLVFLFLPAIVAYGVLQHRKAILKKEIKSQIAIINESNLEILSFTEKQSKEELRWEHSKEFEYKGQMYDVVKSQEKDDSIVYWCWLDAEESELNKKLKSILTGVCLNDEPIKDNEVSYQNFYKSLFYQVNKESTFLKCLYLQFEKRNYQKSNYHFFIIQSNFRPPIFLWC